MQRFGKNYCSFLNSNGLSIANKLKNILKEDTASLG